MRVCPGEIPSEADDKGDDRMRREWLFLWGIMGFLWWSGAGVAWAADPEDAWLREAHAIHESVQEEAWGEARLQLSELAEAFVAVAPQAGWEPEAMTAISDCMIALDQTLSPASLRPGEALDRAEQLWLAFDARIHPHQPLWHGYEEVFYRDRAALEAAVQAGRPERIRSALHAWNHHLNQIRPALAVSLPPESVHPLQAQMDALGQVSPGDLNAIRGHLTHWDDLLPALFSGSEEELLQVLNPSDPPVGAALLLLGALIAVVLGYVALQKYRYEKKPLASRG